MSNPIDGGPLKIIEKIRSELTEILRNGRDARATLTRIERWMERHHEAIEGIAGDREAEDFDACRSINMMGVDVSLGHTIDNLESFFSALIADMVAHPDSFPRSKPATEGKMAVAKKSPKRIFIVHGRNVAMRETTNALLMKLGLTPIILGEEPNSGKTIIEKFKGNADVGFAVVLLTGDDIGTLKEAPDKLKIRARQNVIFELGYFMGSLDKERVAILVENGVEVPSDLQGIGYIPFDEGGHWKFLLVREMRAAGIDVDANKI